ncbi:MAG: PaREP1 family protein [archaeon]|nr:PaREP1 family protein [archaeon]
MSIEIAFPEKIMKKLEEISRSEEVLPEEIIHEAVLEYLKLTDPETKTALHVNLSERYIDEADEHIKKEDYVQASEKLWGAASQMVKAVAAKRNVELRSHGDLNRFVADVRREVNEPEIRRVWQIATSLHQNFYEAWLPGETVKESVEDIKRFREMLERILQPQP